MRSRLALVGVLALVVILLLWNFVFFAPAGRDVDKAKQRRDQAQQDAGRIDKQLRDLKKISAQAPEQTAELEKLNAAVPPTPDLEGFIRSAVELEQQAGVDWVDIEPSQPTPGAGASEIKMTIVVSGGFFQVLDYLNRLDALTRIVVVDGIDITTAAPKTSTTTGSTHTPAAPTTGAPDLTVTLNARMFTQSTLTPATTTGPGSRTPPTGNTSTSSASSTTGRTGTTSRIGTTSTTRTGAPR